MGREGRERKGRRKSERENERHKIQYLDATIYEDCKQRAEEELLMNLKEHWKSVKLWKPRAESVPRMEVICSVKCYLKTE